MIRGLKWLALPLVAFCLSASLCIVATVDALAELGNGMGRIAAWTFGTFLATTCIAAMLGVTLAAAFHPGHNGDLSSRGMPTGIHTGKIFVLLGASNEEALNHVHQVLSSIMQHLPVKLCSRKRVLC